MVRAAQFREVGRLGAERALLLRWTPRRVRAQPPVADMCLLGPAMCNGPISNVCPRGLLDRVRSMASFGKRISRVTQRGTFAPLSISRAFKRPLSARPILKAAGRQSAQSLSFETRLNSRSSIFGSVSRVNETTWRKVLLLGGISGGIFWTYAKIDEKKQVNRCSLHVPPPLPLPDRYGSVFL